MSTSCPKRVQHITNGLVHHWVCLSKTVIFPVAMRVATQLMPKVLLPLFPYMLAVQWRVRDKALKQSAPMIMSTSRPAEWIKFVQSNMSLTEYPSRAS